MSSLNKIIHIDRYLNRILKSALIYEFQYFLLNLIPYHIQQLRILFCFRLITIAWFNKILISTQKVKDMKRLTLTNAFKDKASRKQESV